MNFRTLNSKIISPIIKELPIILVFFFIIKANLMEFFQDNDYDTFWDYLSAFSIWFLYAYFIAATISIFNKAWIRWTWYAVLFSLYAVSCFLAVNFEMKICPTLMTLLVETNGREAGEFAKTYLLTPDSIKVYLKVITYIVITILIEFGYRKRGGYYVFPKGKIR